MTTAFLYLLLALVVGVSTLITGSMRYYAYRTHLIDIPNARSSHSIPTPRGGGIALVLSFLIAVVILFMTDHLAGHLTYALLGAGGMIALVGFLDDQGHIAVRFRLLAHFCSVAWALSWLGGIPPLTVFSLTIPLGWWGGMIATLGLVWLINLYNFMDGIDGLAGCEALCVSLSGAFLYSLLGYPDKAVLPLVLAAASVGFLFWNFPPARIFMGDTGSGFLGIILGLLALQATWIAPQLLWSWLILLSIFIVDATLTLFYRLMQREKIYEAHCTHAYQYASRYFGKHLPVTLGITALNILWLLPMSIIVALNKLDGATGLVVAYVPIVVLAVIFKAGQKMN